ncbi:MAG: peptidase S41, partial [Bacteroidales bacterium]
TYAESKGVRRRPVYINISKSIILRQLESYIVRNIMGEEAFYRTFLRDDNTLNTAIDVLKKGEAFPKAPANEQ